uniref:Uncharacterized protein n=1 Tax=Nelumbo nucifera TaxID=4432 RepID=A0A822ZL63_NELNU|nr:TPA_asm: hypothetical protein HUJ06_004152 [Nelumbo nucifera]
MEGDVKKTMLNVPQTPLIRRLARTLPWNDSSDGGLPRTLPWNDSSDGG